MPPAPAQQSCGLAMTEKETRAIIATKTRCATVKRRAELQGDTMITSNRRRFLTLTAAAMAAPALPRLTGAEAAWPAEKTIRALVPFSAGSTIDIIGRIV